MSNNIYTETDVNVTYFGNNHIHEVQRVIISISYVELYIYSYFIP